MPPPNDFIANATLITVPGTYTVTTVDAAIGGSAELDDDYRNVWLRIEPSEDVVIDMSATKTSGTGNIEVDPYLLIGSDPPTTFADIEYRPYGWLGDGTANPVGINGPQGGQRRIHLVAGEVYFLDCYDYDFIDGEYTMELTIDTYPFPANDNWEDAHVFNQPGARHFGSNIGATIQFNSPTEENWEVSTEPSVWYRIEALDDGVINFSVLNVTDYRTPGSDFRPTDADGVYRFAYDVYEPTTPNPSNLDDIFNGTFITSNQDQGEFSAQFPYNGGGWEPWLVQWMATAGQVFYVQFFHNAINPPPFGTDAVEGEWEVRCSLREWTEFDAADGINNGSSTTSIVDTDWVLDEQYRLYVTNETFKGNTDYTKTFEVEPGLSGDYHVELYVRWQGDFGDNFGPLNSNVVIRVNDVPLRVGVPWWLPDNDDEQWFSVTEEFNLFDGDDIWNLGIHGVGGPRYVRLAPSDVVSFDIGSWEEDMNDGGTSVPPENFMQVQKVRFSPASNYDRLSAWKGSTRHAEMWQYDNLSRLATRSLGNKMYVFDDAWTTHSLDNSGFPPTVFERALGVWVYELIDGRMEKTNDDDLNLGASGGQVHDLHLFAATFPSSASSEAVMKDLTVMPNGDVYCLWVEQDPGGTLFTGDWYMVLAHYDEGSETWTTISDDVTGNGSPIVDFFPTDVSIDNDGTDLYMIWGENRDFPSTIGYWWRCKKYDVSGDSFTELGSGQMGFPAASYTHDGDYDYPARLKVSPAGVPWVVWPSFDEDTSLDEFCFAWYWDGDEWIDSEIPHPSLVPNDVHPSSNFATLNGNYIAFAVYNLYYVDLTFCHHDGPSEWPAVMHQWVYNGGGPGDISGFAYFECHGVGDWDNELYIIEGRKEDIGPTGIVGLGRDYPNVFTSAQSDYDGNLYIPFLGGWTQGWKLENDGSVPVWFTQKGFFGQGVDHVYAAKIRSDGEGVTLLGPGFPDDATSFHPYGYSWTDPTSDAGCMVAGTPVAIWRDLPVTWSGGGYFLSAYNPSGAIDLTRVKFRGFALGD